jgi:hypothetical protein
MLWALLWCCGAGDEVAAWRPEERGREREARETARFDRGRRSTNKYAVSTMQRLARTGSELMSWLAARGSRRCSAAALYPLLSVLVFSVSAMRSMSPPPPLHDTPSSRLLCRSVRRPLAGFQHPSVRVQDRQSLRCLLHACLLVFLGLRVGALGTGHDLSALLSAMGGRCRYHARHATRHAARSMLVKSVQGTRRATGSSDTSVSADAYPCTHPCSHVGFPPIRISPSPLFCSPRSALCSPLSALHYPLSSSLTTHAPISVMYP